MKRGLVRSLLSPASQWSDVTAVQSRCSIKRSWTRPWQLSPLTCAVWISKECLTCRLIHGRQVGCEGEVWISWMADVTRRSWPLVTEAGRSHVTFCRYGGFWQWIQIVQDFWREKMTFMSNIENFLDIWKRKLFFYPMCLIIPRGIVK